MAVSRILDRAEADGDVWELAVARARQMYEMFDHVAVSFSGGKDSTATLHAVLEAAHEKPEERLPVRVIFFDEEAIPFETEEYVRRVAQRDDVALEWYCIPIKCGNACSRDDPYWYPWAPESRDKWCRPMPPEAITTLPGYPSDKPSKRLAHYEVNGYLFDPGVHGNAVVALGIRAAESLNRLRAVSRREKDNWLIQHREGYIRGVLWKGYPIYDWQDDDVWTAPAHLGWDYNRAYDVLEMYGVPVSQQRCGPPYGNEPMQGLHQFKECFPRLWDGMVDRVPGAAAAARYARTELYGYGSLPEKPEGLTWPQYIARLLEMHEPVTRKEIAERIRTDMSFHYRRTSDVIGEKAVHPLTGLRWTFIQQIATRGDRMHRKDHTFFRIPEGTPEYDKAYAKYTDEIARIKAEGRYKELR